MKKPMPFILQLLAVLAIAWALWMIYPWALMFFIHVMFWIHGGSQ